MADCGDAQKPDAVLYKAAKWAAESGGKGGESRKIDVLLCDTTAGCTPTTA